MHVSLDSAAWRDLVVAGDPGALDRFVDEMSPVIQARVSQALLRRQGSARGRDVRQELEDIVQDVFSALFARGGRVLRQWDPQRGLSFKGFVGLVAEHEVASIMRSGKRSPWAEDPTEELDVALPPEPARAAERLVEGRQAVSVLLDELVRRTSPLGMHLFRLLFVDELSIPEVEQQTGLSADAIYAWRSRLRKLAREIADTF